MLPSYLRPSRETLLSVARAAERLGFDSVWTNSHTVVPASFKPRYPYSENGVPSWNAKTDSADVPLRRTLREDPRGRRPPSAAARRAFAAVDRRTGRGGDPDRGRARRRALHLAPDTGACRRVRPEAPRAPSRCSACGVCLDLAGRAAVGGAGSPDGGRRRRSHGDRPALRRSTGKRARALRGRIHPALDALEHRRNALPAADAERREPVALLALAQLVHEREREARARRAERMAKRDRAAVHVRLLAVEAEIFLHGEVLRGEGLVDLDEIHVGDLEASALERLTR